MRRKGFTLIELLVVIAIIGILAALIIVSLSGARAKATDTQLKNNARNIDTALAQYYQDFNSVYPLGGGTVAAPTIVTLAASGTVATALSPYFSGGATSTAYTFSNVGTGYLTAAANQGIYALATGLRNSSEAPTLSGNGIYCTNGTATAAGPVCGAATTPGAILVPSSSAITLTSITGGANNTSATGQKAFVTYGPQ